MYSINFYLLCINISSEVLQGATSTCNWLRFSFFNSMRIWTAWLFNANYVLFNLYMLLLGTSTELHLYSKNPTQIVILPIIPQYFIIIQICIRHYVMCTRHRACAYQSINRVTVFEFWVQKFPSQVHREESDWPVLDLPILHRIGRWAVRTRRRDWLHTTSHYAAILMYHIKIEGYSRTLTKSHQIGQTHKGCDETTPTSLESQRLLGCRTRPLSLTNCLAASRTIPH